MELKPGLKLNYLTFIREDGKNKYGEVMIICECDCEEHKQIRIKKSNFLSGRTKSCGCAVRRNRKRLEFPKEDLTGKVFGKLTVLRFAGYDEKSKAKWTCQCSCENKTIFDTYAYNLKSGNTTSCNCRFHINLIGRTFGQLTVIDEYPIPDNCKRERRWLCECNCENHTKVIKTTGVLLSGKIRSCGCYLKTRVSPIYKHGDRHSRLYDKWWHMKSRCYSPKAGNYYNYGGRGIDICDKWRYDYPTFKKLALENGWDENIPNLTLDRYDPNDDYKPDNCRWIPLSDQARTNRRTIKYFKDRLIEDICKENDVPYQVARKRIIDGWKIPLACSVSPSEKELEELKD